jgi:hypothetical protein
MDLIDYIALSVLVSNVLCFSLGLWLGRASEIRRRERQLAEYYQGHRRDFGI